LRSNWTAAVTPGVKRQLLLRAKAMRAVLIVFGLRLSPRSTSVFRIHVALRFSAIASNHLPARRWFWRLSKSTGSVAQVVRAHAW